ncbi:MAG: hypothetical protein IPH06_05490 [Alphaproteobacteria bacterium]|nr:hypothetical protein [Alphaproteobacteria bacterium]QQS57475.1 MAG: hypothetical protein IPN28_01255 [Alphaproteobacteria bacterium]
MDVDFLLTETGDVGLLSSENLFKKVAGILFDHENGRMTLEYTDMDYLDLNIPVEPEFFGTLDLALFIHVGAVKNNFISQAYQVPLMFLNDPYRGEIFKHVRTPPKPLESYFYFISHCVLGQPVHRLDAGDEDTLGCILGDTLPSELKFAPHLERRKAIESRPEFAYTPNAPTMGLGGGAVSHPSERMKIIREARKRPEDGETDGADEGRKD